MSAQPDYKNYREQKAETDYRERLKTAKKEYVEARQRDTKKKRSKDEVSYFLVSTEEMAEMLHNAVKSKERQTELENFLESTGGSFE